MDYATLQTNVESAMGRSDVPSYVYTLCTAAINRDMRLLDMQNSTTVTTASHPVDLSALSPAFHSVISLYAEVGGDKRVLRPVTDQGAQVYIDTGAPRFYAIRDDALILDPEPDGTYTLYLEYIGKLSDLSADADTNDVMSRYPDLYTYCALTHAAIWAMDVEKQNAYGNAYAAAKKLAEKDDMRRRIGTSVETRFRRTF